MKINKWRPFEIYDPIILGNQKNRVDKIKSTYSQVYFYLYFKILLNRQFLIRNRLTPISQKQFDDWFFISANSIVRTLRFYLTRDHMFEFKLSIIFLPTVFLSINSLIFLIFLLPVQNISKIVDIDWTQTNRI
jgi:hypothetical protein